MKFITIGIIGLLALCSEVMADKVPKFGKYQEVERGRERPQRMDAGDEWRDYVIKELDLSKAQADKVEKIRDKYKRELRSLKKNNWKLRRELLELSKKPEKGEGINKQLRAKHEEVQKARDEYGNKRFEMMLEVRGVLEPEQLADIDDVVERKWGYHKWKHKKRKQAQDSPHKPMGKNKSSE